jgi:phosphoglycerate dehydrogenase-like enzyme
MNILLSQGIAERHAEMIHQNHPDLTLVTYSPHAPIPAAGEAAEAAFLSDDLIVALHTAQGMSKPPPWIAQLPVLPQLRWVHTASAGVDDPLFHRLLQHGVLLTNAIGVRRVPIGQHTLLMMLYFARCMPKYLAAQREHRWDPGWGEELTGKTVGIVGLGHIGQEVARLSKAFGMRVLAMKRRMTQVEWVDQLLPPTALHQLLPESDFVVISTALTPETRGLFGEKEFDLMKPTAYLLNVARGAIVQETQLIKALQAGKIAGAYLDVFEWEPLPPESPLFDMPNVVITPHCCDASPLNESRDLQLFLDNLVCFKQGKPLINIVQS